MFDPKTTDATPWWRRISAERSKTLLPYLVSVCALGVSLFTVTGNGRDAEAQDTAATPQQRSALITLQNAFTNIADSVQPAVVGIHARGEAPRRTGSRTQPGQNEDDRDDIFPFPRRSPFGDLFPDFPQVPNPPRPTASGSGVIIRRSGNDYYVLTNYHVVEGASRIQVTVDGLREEVPGKLVGKGDPKTDLAVVKITLPPNQPESRVARLGDSSGVRVGQWAIAIGNPLDLGQTLTVGVVSARRPDIGRIGSGYADYRDMIQTDASINPGNSGGALVDINGEVIGINTAIASPFRGSVGIGFAIPVNTAKAIVDQLIEHGEVVRGYLGVSVSQLNRELRPELQEFYGVKEGALIENVEDDTPASRAGLQAEDVIIRWGDTPIRNFDDLERSVANTPPGRRVPIRVVRDKRELTLTVTTEKRPPEEELQRSLGGQRTPRGGSGRGESTRPGSAEALGVTVREMTAQERDTYGVSGVVVSSIASPTDLAEAGLFEGDVITRVNRTPVRNLSDFRTATRNLTRRDTVVLNVVRRVNDRQASAIVVIKPPPEP